MKKGKVIWVYNSCSMTQHQVNYNLMLFYIHGMDSMGQEYANKGGTAEVFRSFCPC